MGYGIGGHVGISFQNSFGESNVDSMHYVPILSETMTEGKPPLRSEAVKSTFAQPKTYEGFNEISGGLVMDAHPILVGKVLTAFCGQADPTLGTSEYTHVIKPKDADFCDRSAVPPMSIEVYRNAGSASLYSDCNANAITLEIAHNALIKTTMEVIGANFAKVQKQTPAYLTGSEYTWDQASFSVNGSGLAILRSMTLSLSNNIEAIGTLDGTKKPYKIKRTSYRTVDASGTLLFENDDQLDLFRAQTEHRWLISVIGAEVASGYNGQLLIDMPSFRYGSFTPQISGAGLIEVPFEGTAEYNAGSGTEIQFSVVNSLSNYL